MSEFDPNRKGFLVPERFHEQPVTTATMNTASVFLGLSLASALFAAAKATQQSVRMWKRHKTLTSYIIMVWLHWAANISLGLINWLYMWGSIVPSFWLFLGILIVWVAQTQLLVQIIINRLALLLVIRQNGVKLKWGVAAIMTAINVSVFCVWIPARLQISDSYINFNKIWDPLEKCLFLLIDLGLNICFIHLVKNRLIANGLTKYNRLLHVNIGMVAVNLSLDVVFIGLMWLPNTSVYLNFQSFAYICKLYIEMTMADLIRKVVRGTKGASSGEGTSEQQYAQRGANGSSAKKTTRFAGGLTTGLRGAYGAECHSHIELESREDPEERAEARSPDNVNGIQRTIVTEVVHTKVDEGRRYSQGSSQQELAPRVSVE